jgi:predicted lysophospholipase L1 biosynthesis ABC-type transport system permease subunit
VPLTEARTARALGQTYPPITAIHVKDAGDVHPVFAKVMTAVRVAAV